MQEKKTSVFSNSLIWFGAAISIAEIMTGTLLAPLGMAKGTAAILLGHLIGCTLFYFAGRMGGETGKSSMETARISFGQKGSLLFAVLNVIQLAGWTAIMIIGGARAAGTISASLTGSHMEWIWSLVIGGLILVWILIGVTGLGKMNAVVMSALFLLTIVMSVIIFKGKSPGLAEGSISFGAAVELSVAMPLSWLPVVSDYTRSAQKPRAAAMASTVTYFIASSWMYLIGMGAAVYTAESDIAAIFLKAGLGAAGLVIFIASTVTTTFLDTYSAGVSASSISSRLHAKKVAVFVCVMGTVLAILTPMEQFENFLYLIGSVFAPMIAIMIADYFILKQDFSADSVNARNLILWVIGFIIYRIFMKIDTPVGNTLPVMLIIILLSVISHQFVRRTQTC